MSKFWYIDNASSMLELVKELNRREYAVLDVETTGVDQHSCDLVDIQLGHEDKVCMFSPELRQWLTHLTIPLVGHNLKFDFTVLHRHGVDLLDKPFHDTMLLDHLYNETNPHDLGSVAKRFGIQSEYKNDFWGKYKSYTEAPFEERFNYACSDIVVTDKVYKVLRDTL